MIDAPGRAGVRALFKTTAGNHYAPFLPRLEMALEALTVLPGGGE